MPKSMAVATRNAQAEAYAAQLNAGKIRVYSGTPPASADAALSGNTLLAECTFGNPAFGAASNGTVTANAIAPDTSADATGTATFYRTLTSGNAVVEQGTVGTSGADMIVPTTSVAQGVEFRVTSFTHTVP